MELPFHCRPQYTKWAQNHNAANGEGEKMMRALSIVAVCFAAMLLPASAAETSKVLIDSANNVSVTNWAVTASDWAGKDAAKWSVRLRTLHGGRQEGVQVIEVDNGAMQF